MGTFGKLARGALGALNPVDIKGVAFGFGQLAITKIQESGGSPGNQQSPIGPFKYDVANTFRRIDNATVGTASMQGKTEDVAAMQINGKWYALDPLTKKPYGLPLVNFTPAA